MLASLLRVGDGGLKVTSLMGTVSVGRFKTAHMAALATATAVLYSMWKRWRDRPQGAVFMPGHWLLGNLPEFLQASWRKEQLDFLCEQHRQLGRTLVMKFPFTSWWVVTTRPENVEHILNSNFANYPKVLGGNPNSLICWATASSTLMVKHGTNNAKQPVACSQQTSSKNISG